MATNPNGEDEITRLALEELQKEAVRGKQRSDTMGVAGWMKPKMRPNTRFLKNTLAGPVRQREQELKTTGGCDTRRGAGKDTGINIDSGEDPELLQTNHRHSRKTTNFFRAGCKSTGVQDEKCSKRVKHSPEVERGHSEVKKSRSSVR